jgi:hypothetical protein
MRSVGRGSAGLTDCETWQVCRLLGAPGRWGFTHSEDGNGPSERPQATS